MASRPKRHRSEGRSANGRPRFNWRETEGLTPEDRQWFEEKEALAALWPYIASTPPGDDNWPAYCPLHPDAHPSMSINFRKGVWYCHAGCGGGRIEDLLAWPEGWVPKDQHPKFTGRRP
jgi:hypothetical protein